jgi:hypothetical protein
VAVRHVEVAAQVAHEDGADFAPDSLERKAGPTLAAHEDAALGAGGGGAVVALDAHDLLAAVFLRFVPQGVGDEALQQLILFELRLCLTVVTRLRFRIEIRNEF